MIRWNLIYSPVIVLTKPSDIQEPSKKSRERTDLEWNLSSSICRTSKVLRLTLWLGWGKTCAWTFSARTDASLPTPEVLTLGGCPSLFSFLTIPPRRSLRTKERRVLLGSVYWLILATSKKVACCTHASLSLPISCVSSVRNALIPGLLLPNAYQCPK